MYDTEPEDLGDDKPEDKWEECGEGNEEAESVTHCRSPTPAGTASSEEPPCRSALTTPNPSLSTSDSLDGFAFDRMSFEARESRQALADIGGSGQTNRTKRSQPNHHHFHALSEPVYRAIVVKGFLGTGNRLSRQPSYSTAEFPIGDIPRFFDQQVSAYVSSDAPS